MRDPLKQSVDTPGARSVNARDSTQSQVKLPLVSVVVPCKDRAIWLRPTIYSILDQDYANLECIVIDGGSTDETLEILKSYGGRISWRSRPDRGPFDAINEGWQLGSGEILAWLNADDVWEDGAVSKAVSFLLDHPGVDVVYGSCGVIDELGIEKYVMEPRDWNLREAVLNCDHIIFQPAAFMKRRILEKVAWLYPAWNHDHDLWLRIALAGGVFKRTPEVLAHARDHPYNAGFVPSLFIEGKVGLTRRFFETPLLPKELQTLKKRSISNAYLRCIYYLSPRKLRSWPLSLKLLAKAAAADPFNLPHLSNEIVSTGLTQVPVIGPLIGMTSRFVTRALRSAKRAPRVVLALFTGTPFAAVSIALGVAAASNPSSVEAASAIFFYVSIPLILLLALNELKRQK